MIKELSITIKPEEENNKKIINRKIIDELKSKLSITQYNSKTDSIYPVFIKKSIDARHGQVKIHLRYKVYINEAPQENSNALPEWKKADDSKPVLIVGAGPAGLFGALALLEKGFKPIILERGTDTAQRKKDIALISTKNLVNENSNYCFGEGGAGTFSDGKLYTRSNKRGDISKILKIFVAFGADEKILTDAHPHIGTDKLPKVINGMKDKIRELGGEIHFNTKVTELIIENNRATGLKTENTLDGNTKDFYGKAILLATGHSASDIYTMLAKQVPAALEAKTFAAGVRVEHPRQLIDSIQYHGKKAENLGAAEYRVTTQIKERGVYSFCMCPGGFVVPSATGPEEIVVNGMSTASRNSAWSNAAIVVEIRPEDIPAQYIENAKKSGCKALAGLLFRTAIEHAAKEESKSQAAPAQLLKDFLDNKKSTDLPKTSYTPGLVPSNMNEWLPKHISTRLKEGFLEINKNMKGFISNSALMIGPETRTSTPVRILRNKETYECTALKGLYPSGEGSGYSGGIVSSAMDGENSACAIINCLL